MSSKVEICGVNTAHLPKLKNSDMDALIEKIKQGDNDAKELFISANLRLVLSVVHRFSYKNENPDDLFQVGTIGLIKAINNFDTTLNVRFSTYAVPMIIGEIKRFLRDNNAVRVSRSIRDTAYQIMLSKEKLTKQNRVEPTLEEISKDLGLKVREVAFALDSITEPVSLFDPVYSDGSETVRVMDQIGDKKNNQDEWVENLALKDALKKLGKREKQILLLRYYLGKTQMEVSEEVGISQAQVSRLEKNAIEAMRKNI